MSTHDRGGTSTLSLACLLGYIVAVMMILSATGNFNDIPSWCLAAAGSFVLGLHYSACDRAEGRLP
jgi:hypothetical protein